jgi:hypothetical protein
MIQSRFAMDRWRALELDYKRIHGEAKDVDLTIVKN